MMTELRVIPGKIDAVNGGVCSTPALIKKMFSPAPR